MAKKTVVQKIKEAVDHVIHQEAASTAVEAAPAKKVRAPKAEKSSEPKSDYASHPKFAKFKSFQGAE